MVATKRCPYGTCRDDFQYPQSWKRNSDDHSFKFFRFPGAVRQNERRQRWITACHRGESFVYTKDSYICSVHFVGGNGPTKQYPDPISAVASKEKVGGRFFCLQHYLQLKYCLLCAQLMWLNGKQKPCDEHEADKDRSKKICLE